MENQIEIKKPQDCTHYGYPKYEFYPVGQSCSVPQAEDYPEIRIRWETNDCCSIDTFEIDYSLDGGSNWINWGAVKGHVRIIYMAVKQDGKYLIRVTGKIQGEMAAFDVVKVDMKEEKRKW